MSQTYELRTISDLLKVPLERRADCLREIEYSLALHELALGEGAGATIEVFEWCDDGDKSVSLMQPDGEVIVTLNVTDSPAGRSEGSHEQP